MISEWLDDLARNGARIAEGAVEDFGAPGAELRAALDGDVITDLSHLGLIGVTGPDAAQLLQGQLTSDLAALTQVSSQLAAWCSPKGRVIASMRVILHGDAYLLQLPSELLDPTLRRLRLFVLRADVELADASNTCLRTGLSGPAAPALVARVLDADAPVPGGAAHGGNLTVLGLPGTHPRFEAIGTPEAIRALWDTATAGGATPAGRPAWELLDVLAGLPEVYPATVDAFVPQMLNLQALDGVSFTKGCYVGQEIVARTQHLGKLKRRMYLALTEATPAPGDPLFGEEGGEGRNRGLVVRAAPHPDGGTALLAVLPVTEAETGAVRAEGPDGPELRLERLPYPVGGEEAA